LSKQLQGVSVRPPITGRAEVTPRLILPARGDSFFAVCSANSLEVAKFLTSPVIEFSRKVKSSQEVRDGWDRIIKEIDFSDICAGAKPLIVSARNNWNIYDGAIHIIEKAYIIDGSQYLEFLLRNGKSENIPLIVIFNKSENEELEIRQAISGVATFSMHDIKNKVGTDAPRLTIDEFWKDINIVSDPFVIKTGMGYTAAINVIEMKSNTIHHIIVGAKSLGSELESIRSKFGSLAGVSIRIRKQSVDQRSPYELTLK